MVKHDEFLLETSASPAVADNVEWRHGEALVEYEHAISQMEQRVAEIRNGMQPECIWLLEHPSLYTAGTSADPTDLLSPDSFPVVSSGRGGQYTYHGPGQRVAYVMLDLGSRGKDVRAFVSALENWIIETLYEFGVKGERRKGRVGVWVGRPELGPGREHKIAAIGVRVRRWVTFHGLSLNVNPELDHYAGIVPCGVRDHGVTSMADLGVQVSMREVDATMRRTFQNHF